MRRVRRRCADVIKHQLGGSAAAAALRPVSRLWRHLSIDDQRIDRADRLCRVRPLRAGVSAVHDRVAATQLSGGIRPSRDLAGRFGRRPSWVVSRASAAAARLCHGLVPPAQWCGMTINDVPAASVTASRHSGISLPLSAARAWLSSAPERPLARQRVTLARQLAEAAAGRGRNCRLQRDCSGYLVSVFPLNGGCGVGPSRSGAKAGRSAYGATPLSRWLEAKHRLPP